MTQQEWHATVSFASVSATITDDQADALAAHLPGYAIARHDGQRIHLEATVGASTAARALDEALRVARAAYTAAFDLTGTIVGVKLLTEEDHLRTLAHPPPLDLVTVADAAAVLGVSRQRVHELIEDNPDFPEPIATVKTGKLYSRKSIEAFDEHWDRKVGRPSRR